MDNNIILIMIYFLFNSQNDSNNNQLHTITDYIKSIEIEPKYTYEKLKLVKNILPLLPIEYTASVHKSILLSEKIVNIIEIADVMNKPSNTLDYKPIDVASNKERVEKIISIVQTDFPKPKLKNIGLIMDLVLNMDKYKNIFKVVSSLSSNTESSKNSNNMMNIMEAFVDNGDKKGMDSIKEMAKMMELLKVLDAPKREKPMEG